MSASKPAKRGPPGITRLAGMGVELAAAVVAFCLVGYWIDHHFENDRPWGLIVCALLGIVGGLYNLIRKALRESLRPDRGRGDRQGSDPDDEADV